METISKQALDALARMQSTGEETNNKVLSLLGMGALLAMEADQRTTVELSEELQAKAAKIVLELMDEEDQQAALAALPRIKIKGKSVEEVKVALAFEMMPIEKIQEIILDMMAEDKQELLDLLSEETRHKVITNKLVE